MNLSHYSAFPVFDLFGIFEELPPKKREILRSGNGRQVPCREQTNSSLDSALKDRDCVELPVQMPFLGRVFSHDLQKGRPKGHLKSAQKPLKTFKTRLVG